MEGEGLGYEFFVCGEGNEEDFRRRDEWGKREDRAVNILRPGPVGLFHEGVEDTADAEGRFYHRGDVFAGY